MLDGDRFRLLVAVVMLGMRWEIVSEGVELRGLWLWLWRLCFDLGYALVVLRDAFVR